MATVMQLNADDWLAVVLIDNEGTAHLRDSGEIPNTAIAAALRELADHLAPFERLEVAGNGQAELLSTALCTICGQPRDDHQGIEITSEVFKAHAEAGLSAFEDVPTPRGVIPGAPRFTP